MENEAQKRALRCIVCGSEMSSEYSRQWKCPICGTIVAPAWIKHDMFLKLNWQDIRLLVLYSKSWSNILDRSDPVNNDADKALESIISKLRVYQPADGLPMVFPPDKRQEQKPIIIELKMNAEGNIEQNPPGKIVPTGRKFDFKDDGQGRIVWPENLRWDNPPKN